MGRERVSAYPGAEPNKWLDLAAPVFRGSCVLPTDQSADSVDGSSGAVWRMLAGAEILLDHEYRGRAALNRQRKVLMLGAAGQGG
jgi:hypothetical protein